MSRDNYNPYRIVGAKKIDVWFYEEGDMRRTHCRRGGRYRSPLFLYDVMQLCVQSPSVCISATGSIIPSS